MATVRAQYDYEAYGYLKILLDEVTEVQICKNAFEFIFRSDVARPHNRLTSPHPSFFLSLIDENVWCYQPQALHAKIASCAEALKDEEFELIHFINNEIAQICILIVQVPFFMTWHWGEDKKQVSIGIMIIYILFLPLTRSH